MTTKKQQEIIDAMKYELRQGVHTFTMCDCGRTGCRAGKCIFCLAGELINDE